jgi:hypothetical protein
MSTSILIARIFAILFLSIAIAAIKDKLYYQKIIKHTFENKSLMLMYGFFTITISYLIIHYHNIWQSNWTVLITLFGWLGLLKGIIFIVHPKILEKLSRPIFIKLRNILPYTTLIIGLILAYFGFFY